ncbi:MAG TPA: tripartite tricarboxylate transporter substrate binding protein [Burkholderiales bacterium]|nr:tripartite tricarboxylate transporter substrate binding protein [Burkholderiales bacterium]
MRVVVPYPAGTTPDIIGRTLAERLQKAMGQPFVVENRSGAGGNIGTEAVVKAPADGHTLLVGGNGPVAINRHLYKGLSYDPERDLAPISLLASAPQLLVAKNDFQDFGSFIRHARQNPGRLSYASVGGGSAAHLTMELLKSDARVDLVHVPYRGFPPAVTDLLSGNIDAMFAIIPAVLPQVRAGKIRALAVTALQRSAMSPDVPSVAELGLPALESLAWNGLLAPAGTPPEILARLSAETVKGLRQPEAQEALGRLGFEVVASSPDEFARWIRAESEKWARVIRVSGATID